MYTQKLKTTTLALFNDHWFWVPNGTMPQEGPMFIAPGDLWDFSQVGDLKSKSGAGISGPKYGEVSIDVVLSIWSTKTYSNDQHQTYPLVNVNITMEKSQFSMGTSTISMAIFNSKLLVYQRVYPIKSH